MPDLPEDPPRQRIVVTMLGKQYVLDPFRPRERAALELVTPPPAEAEEPQP